jgi:hypothetical protein
MIIQYQQETISDVNDMVATIRQEAIDLRHRDNVKSINDIIDLTYQIANLLQEGAFQKEATA